MGPTARACAACGLAGALTAGIARESHAADACDPLYESGIKSVQTPHRVRSTTTGRGGKSASGEAIYAGGVEYLQLGGKWTRSPTPQQDMIEAAQEKLKTHPDVCTFVGERTEGGEAVSVYKAHSKELGTDQEVRILKSSGLLEGATMTLPNGSVVETRYEYGNVTAPAVPGRPADTEGDTP
ncbi:MAG TPA: hypothetical protein VG871_23865 [Vicinamibacterales bacterium]|nr:hypothetical protein [Vicinamibacterales bacterium]